MKPQIILSVSHLGQLIGVDRRTVLRRLERANVAPDFVSVSGEWFFAQATAEKLVIKLGDLESADDSAQSVPEPQPQEASL